MLDNCNYNQPQRRHYHRRNRSFDTMQSNEAMNHNCYNQNCYNQNSNSASVLGGITEKGSSFMATPVDLNNNWNPSGMERPFCRRKRSENCVFQQPMQPAQEQQNQDMYLFYPTDTMEETYSEQYGAYDYIEPTYEVEEAFQYYPEYRMEETNSYQPEMVNVNYEVKETCTPYGIDQMPVGMGYVPCQQWRSIYEPEHALYVGTIFQELDLAFMEGGCLVK